MEKILIVLNPISGGIDKEPFMKRVESFCQTYAIPYEVFRTTGKNDDQNLMLKVQAYAPQKIGVIGGDGTLLFAGKNLIGSQIPIGIIPFGSANGMANELGVPKNPWQAFLDFLLSRFIRHVDLLEVNNQYYSLHIGDVGLNANLVNSYEKDKKRGMATYTKYFFEELKKSQPFAINVEMEDKQTKEKCYMAAICNASSYGTGVVINGMGKPDDGFFELVLIKDLGIRTLMDAGMTKLAGTRQTNQHSVVLQGKKAKLNLDKPRILQLDGEVIGEFSEIQLEIIEGAIPLLVKKENLAFGNEV